jgi:hypothetical protein
MKYLKKKIIKFLLNLLEGNIPFKKIYTLIFDENDRKDSLVFMELKKGHIIENVISNDNKLKDLLIERKIFYDKYRLSEYRFRELNDLEFKQLSFILYKYCHKSLPNYFFGKLNKSIDIRYNIRDKKNLLLTYTHKKYIMIEDITISCVIQYDKIKEYLTS